MGLHMPQLGFGGDAEGICLGAAAFGEGSLGALGTAAADSRGENGGGNAQKKRKENRGGFH